MARGSKGSEADVAEAVRLHELGMRYEEIGAFLEVDAKTLMYHVRGETLEELELADIREEDLPLVSAFGVVYWTVPVDPPKQNGRSLTARQRANLPCSVCELEERCRVEVARGNAAGCMRPLKVEFDATWVGKPGGGAQLAPYRDQDD